MTNQTIANQTLKIEILLDQASPKRVYKSYESKILKIMLTTPIITSKTPEPLTNGRIRLLSFW